MSRQYRIGDMVIGEGQEGYAAQLDEAHRNKARPFCLCREPHVPMYIARFGQQLIVKRMPLTGGDHDPDCPSYEPPYELSGLGPLIGSAIQLDPGDGTVALKLDFSLTKMGKRSQTVGEASDSSPVKNETKKLSLRALLHYLWHQGGLTEWTAYWSGKRHWHQVRSHLLEAARIMTAKGSAMSDRLYIPGTFRLEDKAEIEQRRSAALADLYSSEPGPRKLMVLIGEVKEFAAARNGCKMIIRHMPGFPLMLEDAAFRRLQSRYEAQFALWDASESAHLMAIATFGMAPSGIVNVEEIALMVATEQWIPVETMYEDRLVQRLARLSLKSVKGLRFNLSASKPLAAATLPHRRPTPAALYIVPPSADDVFRAELAEMIEARPDMEAWIWNVADGDIPPLPV